MQTLTLGNKIKSWTPNIANIADRLIMGPQREVLQKVQNINQRYGLSLGITRTYRWSPGYMDQIKDYMANKYLEPHMKRKMSTYFNQIDNKQWNYTNLRDSLNFLDNSLYEMRRRNATFQNNTDICEKVLTKFIDIINKSVDRGCGYYDAYISNAQSLNGYNTYNAEMVTFVFYLPDTTMNYYIGKESYSIPIYAATLYYSMPLDELVYKMSSDLNWIEDDNSRIIDRSASYTTSYRNGFAHQWKGSYHRKYVNDGIRTRYATGQLLHPYISQEEYNNRSNHQVTDGEIVNSVAYCCLGQLGDEIADDLLYLRLGNIYSKLLSWHTVFDAINTRPMNQINSLFWGRHKSMDETFSNTVPTAAINCRLNNTNDVSGPKDYCDEIQCLNRDNCNYYGTIEDGGEVADRDGEVRRDPQGREIRDSLDSDMLAEAIMVSEDDRQWNPEEIVAENNIHGGELPDEPQDGGLTMEEQVIRWAAQRGGAVDITNNERNQNG